MFSRRSFLAGSCAAATFATHGLPRIAFARANTPRRFVFIIQRGADRFERGAAMEGVDRILGLGEMPNVRLQRWFAAPGRIRRRDQVLVWSHWLWFLFPHGTVAYLLLRRPEHFPRGAAQIEGAY